MVPRDRGSSRKGLSGGAGFRVDFGGFLGRPGGVGPVVDDGVGGALAPDAELRVGNTVHLSSLARREVGVDTSRVHRCLPGKLPLPRAAPRELSPRSAPMRYWELRNTRLRVRMATGTAARSNTRPAWHSLVLTERRQAGSSSLREGAGHLGTRTSVAAITSCHQSTPHRCAHVPCVPAFATAAREASSTSCLR